MLCIASYSLPCWYGNEAIICLCRSGKMAAIKSALKCWRDFNLPEHQVRFIFEFGKLTNSIDSLLSK